MSIAALLLFIRTLGLTLPLWVVAGWSAAEAVIFFLVADIPISWIAVKSGARAGLLAAVVASFASVVGGLIAYSWADRDPAGASAAMALLPAISPAMIGEAASSYAAQGWRAMLEASFTGIPYKLFAVTAARDENPLLPLLIATPLVRFPRFALIALVASGGAEAAKRWLNLRSRLALLTAVWALFYAFYFAMMPG